MKVVGKTIDNKFVVSGVFIFTDTHGLPLDVVYDDLHSKGYVIAWDFYIEDARKAGWKDKTITAKIRSVL